jgi:type II secretion system protein H
VKCTLSQRGFTLTELMITVAIMGIVAALAFPMVVGRQADRRLDGATQQILWDLMAARQEAITRNTNVQVTFVDSGTYNICQDADGDGIPTCKVTNIQDRYHDITISSTNNPTFLPRGIVTNTATVTVQNGKGSSNDIAVRVTGQVKIK